MAGAYDEDLHENPFFKSLVEKHKKLFSKAEECRWTICVPRCDAAESLKLYRTDFENHVLREWEEGKMKSFNDKIVAMGRSSIQTLDGYRDQRQVSILFEETFFNMQDESYRVLCINQLLEGGHTLQDSVVLLATVQDCREYLDKNSSQATMEAVDLMISVALAQQGSSNPRSSVDFVEGIFTRTLQAMKKDQVTKKLMLSGDAKKKAVMIAIETYIMSKVHKNVFSEICATSAREDEALNRLTRSLQDVNLQRLGVDSVFALNLKDSKEILSKLNKVSTPLEKLICLNDSLSAIARTPSTASIDVAADELVPLAAFLLLKSDIPNWTANFAYLRKFNPSHIMNERHGYCCTTFEVALEYLRTGELTAPDRTENGPPSHNVSLLDRSESHIGDQSLDDLFQAVLCNDIDHVKSILDAKSGTGALCHPLCVCDKCEEIIKRLDNVPTARSRDQRGRTALHYAAKLDYIELVNLLLKHGALVDAPDHNGTTPLHLACQQGKQAAVLFLIDRKADINAMDSDSNTPLHIACSHGHDVIVKSLLFSTANVNVNVNVVNHEENTPLHNAAKWGFSSVVRLLLLHGARLDLPNSSLLTPADVAHSRVKDSIESRRASVRAKSFSVNEGSLPPPRDQQIRRPHRSGRRGHDKEVSKLLAAAESGDVNLVGFLLDWEDPLKSQGPPPELCHPFCQCKQCLPFTQASLNVNSHDANGLTALHKAATHGRLRMCEALVAHKANINARSTSKSLTSLHYACIYNRDRVVRVLIEAGADPTVQDFHGNTPLHSCAISGNTESTKLLLDSNADVNAVDFKGNTPLHQAARWSHVDIVLLLLERGADYSIANEDEQLAYSLCKDEEVKAAFASVVSTKLALSSSTDANQDDPSHNADTVSDLDSLQNL